MLFTVQTATRLRPVSIDRTEKRVSGGPVVSAILTSLVRSWPEPVASRKWSVPVASGVPMFMYRPGVAVVEVPQVAESQPAA